VPSPRLSPKIAKLLAVQMRLIPLAILAVLAFLLYHTRPNAMGTTGGIDPINTFITWMALVVVFGAIIALHLIFGRQLSGEAKGERRGVKSW
jgi:hypothetical protein